ncbi:MAG: hypothetical protein ICV77_14150 [Cyanobacteria bacterium Co-bin8]|nr:hypothetical protein [Cyanobacteria bacterium Co-bin8]
MGVLLSLSVVSTSNLAVQPRATATQLLAQATPAALNCPAERQQPVDSALNVALEQAQQAVNNRQTYPAVQLMEYVLQGIRVMEDSPGKADLLQRLVGSLTEDFAYAGPLERLVQIAPQENADAVLEVLPLALEATRTLGSGYSAAKTRTFVALAHYYTQLGRPDQGSQILTEALAASNAIQGATFQAPALRDIAAAYINAGQVDLALPLLARSQTAAQAMPASNPYQRAAELEQIAALYAQANQLNQALQTVRLVELPDYPSNALLMVVDQYSEAGQTDRALAVLPAFKQPEQKALALATIAGRLTAQQPEQSAQLYAEAIAAAKSAQNATQVMVSVAVRYATTGGLVAIADETLLTITDPLVKAPALGAIALQYGKVGQDDLAAARLTQATETLGAIPEDWSRNRTRQQLIDQAAQLGRYDYALQIVNTIQPGEDVPFDRADALTLLAERALAEGRYDAALQVTEQIPPTFVSSRNHLFLQIAAGFVNSGQLDRALEVANQENPDTGFRPRTLAVIASQVRPPEQAALLFAQAAQLANTIDSVYVRIEVLGAIAKAHLDAGQSVPSTQLLNQAIAASQEVSDASGRSSSLRAIAEHLIFANHYLAAIQVAEAIPEESERLAKLNEAMEKAIAVRDVATVLTVLERLEEPILKTRWQIAAADTFSQLDQPNSAAEVLNQALQTARTIPGEEAQTITLPGEENPPIVDDEQDRGSFLSAIALKYAQLGQVSQAQQIAQSLESPALQQQLRQQISCYR